MTAAGTAVGERECDQPGHEYRHAGEHTVADVLTQADDREHRDQQRRHATYERVQAAHVAVLVGGGEQQQVRDLQHDRTGDERPPGGHPARAGRARRRSRRPCTRTR